MKKRLLTIFYLLCGFLPLNAESNIPFRTVRDLDSVIYVTYDFKDAFIQDDPIFPGSQFWKIDGFGINYTAGEPAFPFRNDLFCIPYGDAASVSVEEALYDETSFILSPARPSRRDNDNSSEVPAIKPYTGFKPQNIVYSRGTQFYRGIPLLRVSIIPIQYDYENSVVRRFKKITYKVSFIRRQNGISKSKDQEMAPNTNTILNNLVLNKQTTKKQKKSNRSLDAIEDNKDYLILTSEKFRQSAERLAKWKRTLGNRVHLCIKNNWTYNQIKDTITFTYYDIIGIKYVLFIGGESDVPSYGGSYQNDNLGLNPSINTVYYPSDYRYGCIDSDTIPDILRGRLLANNNAEASIIVDKIIQYEKNPPTSNTFYNRGLHIAFFEDGGTESNYIYYKNNYEDRRFVLTSEEIRNYTATKGFVSNYVYYALSGVTPLYWNLGEYANGGSIPSYLNDWFGNAADITNRINGGVLYAIYRGHGSENSWGSPNYTTNNIELLNNGNLLPVVFSITCQTGNFTSPNCFAESMLKKANGGGVAVFASTHDSYSGFADAFSEGVFDAIWPDPGLIPSFPDKNCTVTSLLHPIYELGEILDQGLIRMQETWGEPSGQPDKTFCTWERFHCFGDPSMQIWTDIPHNFAEPSIIRTKDSIFVQVNDGEARITFYAPSTGHVDSYVGTAVRYATLEDSITICINRHNYIPYIKESNVVYLQNDTLSENMRIEGEYVIAGHHVTNSKPVGNLIMDGGNINIKAKNKAELHSGTIIKVGTKLNINKQTP